MANYCDSDDIIRELPHFTIDNDSSPTTAEVTQFCTDITADMDSRLRAVGITTPVTDADLLAVLAPIAANGVKAKVLRAKHVEDEDLERAATYQDLYDQALGRIEARPSILREDDEPGNPAGTTRDDDDISFTRTGDLW